MSAYLYPIKIAIMSFPFLALLLALPFLVIQYRRYGAFILSRAFVLYTFVFYMLTAYYMTVLPLPELAVVAKLTTQRMQLVPLTFVREFMTNSGFVFGQPGTWLLALKSSAFLQPAFNMLLTVPFGFYMRYYFRRSWKQVVLLAFGLSLFYELTQLSGLYFIYPRPYRLFDVDDLLINTLGGLWGYALTPLIARAFPNRDKMDAVSREHGQKVGWLRRFVAWFVDYGIINGVLTVIATGITGQHNWLLSTGIPLGVTFVLIPVLTNGTTIGKALVRIRIVGVNRQAASRARIAGRQLLLYGVVAQVLWAWGSTVSLVLVRIKARTELNLILGGILTIMVLFVAVNFLWVFLTHKSRLFYDIWAGTMQISAVPVARADVKGVDQSNETTPETEDSTK